MYPHPVRPEQSMIRLVLADDLMATRKGLRMLFELEPDLVVIGEADSGASALNLLSRTSVDVLVIDAEMPGMDGFATIEALRARGTNAMTIILSIHDDSETRARASAAGAAGFVSKHEGYPALIAMIRELCA
jgi:DNA-binding NarL/FixJ family response regulator